ncbi:MAG: DUF4835 family protein [Bacteroidota bacterium]|nr:DUF4835 family protein [Bacteroidota bacterium]MDP4192131.1 DUF4835 family protein [Bacteroidota bacterium]MDP4196175.1 DUF4835 family protein [Bacteroidota bacterium]
MKKVLFLLLFIPACIFSQELDATVTVNVDKLQASNKDILADFAQSVQAYLNSTRFTGSSWEGDRIKCSFNIFFDTAPDETHYTAEVNITSLRPIYRTNKSSLMLNVLDNNWTFIYQRGQSFYFNQYNFDPLTSFLDFYAYLIIGLDADSYAKLGGSDLFTTAYNISVLAINSSNPTGWNKTSGAYYKKGMIDDLVNEKYRVFREDFFDYHYNGLDIFSSKPKDAQANIAKLVNDLDVLRTKQDIRGVLIKTFFDAKSNEIVSYLSDYQDKNIFSTLKKIDPPHISKYDEAMRSN